MAYKWSGMGWQRQARIKRLIAATLRHRGVPTAVVALPAETPADGRCVNRLTQTLCRATTCVSCAGGEQLSVCHPTGRERMDSSTLQPLQDPILLLSWVCFRSGCFPSPHLTLTGQGVGWRAQRTYIRATHGG